jgi:orotidine 5'-phosphate decarboxylase subfamily 1
MIEGLSETKGFTKENPARVMLVEDVINTGVSVRETIERLKDENVIVVGCVCAMDRNETWGMEVPGTDIPMFSAFTLQDLSRTPFSERAALATTNKAAAALFLAMERKRSNLIWSADIESGAEVLRVLKLIAPHIVAIKLHFDAIDVSLDMPSLLAFCRLNDIMIISDRKYADIESTVEKQIKYGRYEGIVDAATVHSVAGSGPIEALGKVGISSIIVAQMSSSGQACQGSELAEPNAANVMGIVCQDRYSGVNDAGDNFVYMTPGVHLELQTDGQGQNYRSCRDAIECDGCDAVIVGRGICNANNPLEAAKKYQQAAWEALGF